MFIIALIIGLIIAFYVGVIIKRKYCKRVTSKESHIVKDIQFPLELIDIKYITNEDLEGLKEKGYVEKKLC